MKKKDNGYPEGCSEYTEIISEVINEHLGDSYVKIYHNLRDRLHIGITNLPTTHTFFMSGDDYVLDGCTFNNKEFFRDYATQIVNTKLKEAFITAYKNNWIDKLPNKLTFEPDPFNVDNITAEWFTYAFAKIAEYESNSETIENVKLTKVEPNSSLKGIFVIQFDLDCGRRGLFRGLTVSINDKGVVTVDVDDTPIESGGIASVLSECVALKIQGKSDDECLKYED